jgi:hypothetical protein
MISSLLWTEAKPGQRSRANTITASRLRFIICCLNLAGGFYRFAPQYAFTLNKLAGLLAGAVLLIVLARRKSLFDQPHHE